MAYPLIANAEEPAQKISIIGWLLIVLRVLGMVASLAFCLPFHGFWRLAGSPSPWPRIFLRLVSLNIGAVVKTRGHRLKQDVFYVSNHITWFDIPVIAGSTGCTFVAHDGIENWPVIGWLCRLNHTIFVSRNNRMDVGGQIETIREALEEKHPITIFPEGTTSDGRNLEPFKPSLFAAMAPPPKPLFVQPMLLDFGEATSEVCWIGDESAGDNAKRLLSRIGIIPATLHFLEPFDPTKFEDRKAICAEAERRIHDALSASLSAKAIV